MNIYIKCDECEHEARATIPDEHAEEWVLERIEEHKDGALRVEQD